MSFVQSYFPELGGPDPDQEQPLPEPPGEDIPPPPFDSQRLVKERQRLEIYTQELSCWRAFSPAFQHQLSAQEDHQRAVKIVSFRLSATRACYLPVQRRQAEEDACWLRYGLAGFATALVTDHVRRLGSLRQPEPDDRPAVIDYFAA